MQNFMQTTFGILIRKVRPVWLLVGGLTYALGVGVIVFRGEAVNWDTFWSGLFFGVMVQTSMYALQGFFDVLLAADRNEADRESMLQRNGLLIIAVTALVVSATQAVWLEASHVLNLSTALLMGTAFVFVFIYAVPPFRLTHSGYGEIIDGMYIVILLPALGYLLQAQDIFNGLGLLTFPLLALFLAMRLALSLQSYYADITQGNANLLTSLGWQRGMYMHNLLILLAFLLIGAGSLVEFPWMLTWPRLLVLPVGIFEIWQMWQISTGAPTRWKLLNLTSIALFGISLYLNLLMLWAS